MANQTIISIPDIKKQEENKLTCLENIAGSGGAVLGACVGGLHSVKDLALLGISSFIPAYELSKNNASQKVLYGSVIASTGLALYFLGKFDIMTLALSTAGMYGGSKIGSVIAHNI